MATLHSLQLIRAKSLQNRPILSKVLGMNKLSMDALNQLFIKARTHNEWLKKQVDDELLREIYELTKWGATSANTSPARIVFVKSDEAKAKLIACVGAGNIEKIKAAPVTAIIGSDQEFYEKLPKLFPHTDAKAWFAGNASLIETTAFRNSSLQGAYLMLAARALGLDCGPMSGFDNAKVDEAFFSGTAIKSNFICNIGYGDETKLFPRSPRLSFEEACKIV